MDPETPCGTKKKFCIAWKCRINSSQQTLERWWTPTLIPRDSRWWYYGRQLMKTAAGFWWQTVFTVPLKCILLRDHRKNQTRARVGAYIPHDQESSPHSPEVHWWHMWEGKTRSYCSAVMPMRTIPSTGRNKRGESLINHFASNDLVILTC